MGWWMDGSMDDVWINELIEGWEKDRMVDGIDKWINGRNIGLMWGCDMVQKHEWMAGKKGRLDGRLVCTTGKVGDGRVDG